MSVEETPLVPETLRVSGASDISTIPTADPDPVMLVSVTVESR
jgi:hypothetical protein